jgi:CRP-like cAMP-binding protein
MRIAGPGQTFGTVPIFGDRRHWSDAVTMCETLEASWNETDFLALLGADASVAINLIRIVCARLQEMEDRVRELATRRAERRIACTVLRLARQNGRTTPAGIAIDVPLRRKDVADIAGTTLHTASRVLAAWQKAGLLANQSRTLIVKGLPELRAMAEE